MWEASTLVQLILLCCAFCSYVCSDLLLNEVGWAAAKSKLASQHVLNQSPETHLLNHLRLYHFKDLIVNRERKITTISILSQIHFIYN